MQTKIIVPIVIALLIIGGVVVMKSMTATSSTTPSTTSALPTSVISPADSNTKMYALSDVAMHKDATSCWSVINGTVYDLTSWIDRHPGGPEKILGICGADGSNLFNDQHSGARRPARELAGFEIGTLSK